LINDLTSQEKKTVTAIAETALYHLAFDHSLLAHIISTSATGKIVAANTAACKLLGYTKQQLINKKRAAIFEESETSAHSMSETNSALGGLTMRVSMVKKNGRLLPCEITSALFFDELGTELVITTITDRRPSILKQKNIDTVSEKKVAKDIGLALKKSEETMAVNKEWLQFVSKTSYDVMWEWDATTKEFWIGDSIKEVFGYFFSNQLVSCSQISALLPTEESQEIEKSFTEVLAGKKKTWKKAFMLTLADGSVAATTSRASIIRDSSGRALRLIGATQDISRLKKMEKNLKASVTAHDALKELFLEASKLSFEGGWDWNLLTNEFYLGEGFQKLFGYRKKNKTAGFIERWSDYLHPEDKEAVINGLRETIESTKNHWEQSYRFICADGSIAQVLNKASIIRDAEGKAYRMIGAMQDVSKLKILEARLEKEILLKERQITDASDEARETERSDIGRELHDNVNQLLGASRQYIDLASQGGEDNKMLLKRSSEYTQTAIEAIRKLTHRLNTDLIKQLGLREALDTIVRDTMEVNPIKIICTVKGYRENKASVKFKQNLFRIIQEQLNNIIKHSKATIVQIDLAQNKESLKLVISDNGIGFDMLKKNDGIGIANIKSRAAVFNGIAQISAKPNEGCSLQLSFPAGALM